MTAVAATSPISAPAPSRRVAVSRDALSRLMQAAMPTLEQHLADVGRLGQLVPNDPEYLKLAEETEALQRAIWTARTAMTKAPRPLGYHGPEGVGRRLFTADPVTVERAQLLMAGAADEEVFMAFALLAYRCGLSDAGEEVVS